MSARSARFVSQATSTPVARLCAELLNDAGKRAATGECAGDSVTHSSSPTLLLDDGVFYMFSDGALWRRCEPNRAAPRGRYCLGLFFAGGGGWSARLAQPYDMATRRDFEVLAVDVDRLDAIAALWRARGRARGAGL